MNLQTEMLDDYLLNLRNICLTTSQVTSGEVLAVASNQMSRPNTSEVDVSLWRGSACLYLCCTYFSFFHMGKIIMWYDLWSVVSGKSGRDEISDIYAIWRVIMQRTAERWDILYVRYRIVTALSERTGLLLDRVYFVRACSLISCTRLVGLGFVLISEAEVGVLSGGLTDCFHHGMSLQTGDQEKDGGWELYLGLGYWLCADDSKKGFEAWLRFGHRGGGCLKRGFDLGVCW